MATNKETSSSPTKLFSILDQVELVGLQKSPHLNHQIGAVVGDLLDNGRYPVVIEPWSGKKIAVKPENLKLLGDDVRPATCSGCGMMHRDEELKVCGTCQCVQYCSQDCQQAHWHKEHKNYCKIFQQGRLAKHNETELPTDPQERWNVRMAKAARWRQKGKHAHAERELRAVIREHPNYSIYIYAALAETILDQDPGPDRLDEAIALLQKAVAVPMQETLMEQHGFLFAYRLLGDMLFWGRNDLDGAEQAYNEVLRANFEDGNTLQARRGLEEIDKSRKVEGLGEQL